MINWTDELIYKADEEKSPIKGGFEVENNQDVSGSCLKVVVKYIKGTCAFWSGSTLLTYAPLNDGRSGLNYD